MEKYILKYPVYNRFDFPAGTIVSLFEGSTRTFIVMEGESKDETGTVADGLNGWLVVDSEENRKLFKDIEHEKEKFFKAIKHLDKQWSNLPTIKL